MESYYEFLETMNNIVFGHIAILLVIGAIVLGSVELFDLVFGRDQDEED